MTSPILAEFADSARIEWRKAVGYASLALITSLAIIALCTAACFFGFGFVMAPLYGHSLAAAMEFSVHLLLFTGIAGPLTSLIPIKILAGHFFSEARACWNKASALYAKAST